MTRWLVGNRWQEKGVNVSMGVTFIVMPHASVVSMPRYRNEGKCGLNSEVCLIIVPVNNH